jgi:hypothetical protein
VVTYTPILKLTQPDFDQTPWDEQINGDLAILDAAFGKFFAAPGLSGVWQNATTYVVGQSVVEPVDSTIWTCQVSNTSAAAPTTFAQDRTAHPTYWTTTGTVSGYLPTTGGTLTGNLGISGPANTTRGIDFLTSGSIRWLIQAGGEAETGANAGSLFGIVRYNDSGAAIDVPFEIQRDTGEVSVNAMAISGSLSVGGNVATLNLNAASIVTAAQVSIGTTGAYINGDANVVNFVQDGSLNRWTYVRTGPATGEMQYIRGSDAHVLFAIDISGNVFAHGTFTPGGVLSYDDRITELEARIAALEAKV